MDFLYLFGDLTAEETLINTISIVAVSLVIVIGLAICIANRKKSFNTNAIAYGGLCIAASFVLSFLSIGLAYGGSITIAAMVPLFIYCYVYGFGKGLFVGLIYSLLSFMKSPYFLSVPQFLCDYIIPCSAIALACTFKRVLPKTASILAGAGLYSLIKLVAHVASGIIFFNLGWVVPELPLFGDTAGMGGFVYSLTYNLIYMVPETIILLGVLFYLAKSKHFNTLEKFLLKAKSTEATAK